MSEPVKLTRDGGHFRKLTPIGAPGRKTLCGVVDVFTSGACGKCVRIAGKLLTPKQASPLELEAERLISAAGLPAPEKQYRFGEAIGRGWRFDFAWPDRRVALEVDGDLWHGRHTSGDGRQADMVRDAYATAMGWKVLRCDRELLCQGFAVRWINLAMGGAATAAVTICSADFPDERTLAPKRWERKRAKAAARRAEARA